MTETCNFVVVISYGDEEDSERDAFVCTLPHGHDGAHWDAVKMTAMSRNISGYRLDTEA